MFIKIHAAATASFVLAQGCGGARATAPVPAGPTPIHLETAAPPLDDPGRISRSRLLGVLEGGFGRFLQGIETEPAVEDGRFVGFRIKRFAPRWLPGEPAWNRPLRTADVVTRVNGLPIERPEQAFRVFETLRDAGELVLEIERDGTHKELRFPIEDAPQHAPQEEPAALGTAQP